MIRQVTNNVNLSETNHKDR